MTVTSTEPFRLQVDFAPTREANSDTPVYGRPSGYIIAWTENRSCDVSCQALRTGTSRATETNVTCERRESACFFLSIATNELHPIVLISSYPFRAVECAKKKKPPNFRGVFKVKILTMSVLAYLNVTTLMLFVISCHEAELILARSVSFSVP